MNKPLALLVLPPVYDFAFYDLYFRPFGLLRIGRWLQKGGWDCVFVNSLDYRDDFSLRVMKKPQRNRNGTGKMFRQVLSSPAPGLPEGRRFARYGILHESMRARISSVRRPEIILISTFMTYWYKGAEEAAALSREIWPGVPVFTGGIYATLMPDHCRAATGADHVVAGDGWEYLNDYFRKSSLPVCSPEGESSFMDDRVWEDAAVLRLNRGCPMKCRYCASSILSGFAEGSSEAVFGELSELNQRYGTVNFAFYDDALLYRKEKIFLPFLEKVIGSGMNINFYLPNAVHIDYLDSKTVTLMKKAGFREIRLGFESSDPEFHRKNGRKYDTGRFPSLVDELLRSGFRGEEIIIYILAGLPGQYAGEVEDTVRYLKNFNVRISISEYSPVPGSSLWEESVRKSRYPLAEEPLFHNNSIFPMAWERFTYDEMQRLKKLAFEK